MARKASACGGPPVTTSAWWLWLRAPLQLGISPAVAVGLCVFLGENLSTTQPAERYHVQLPLSPCCACPTIDERTGRISPPDTSAGFDAAVLSKDAFKEAQTGG